MYYLDQQMFAEKLHFLDWLVQQSQVLAHRAEQGWDMIDELAQERILHLAMETVTDVGHMLIDCFMLRDAGSYEDIIAILHAEQVFSENVANPLLQLVFLKQPLLKQLERRITTGIHPLLTAMPEFVRSFVAAIRSFVVREFANIGSSLDI